MCMHQERWGEKSEREMGRKSRFRNISITVYADNKGEEYKRLTDFTPEGNSFRLLPFPSLCTNYGAEKLNI